MNKSNFTAISSKPFFVPKLHVIEEVNETNSILLESDNIEQNSVSSISIPDVSKVDKSVAYRELDKTYSISAVGNFIGRGFAIDTMGVNKIPSTLKPNTMEDNKKIYSLENNEFKFDSFHIIRTIGRGSSGTVTLAFDKVSVNIVALKGVGVISSTERHQILNELSALIKLSSPCIVKFYGAHTHESKIEIALEYMNRGSLDSVLRVVHQIPESCLKTIAKQSLIGLYYLHSNKQVHRDIKPGNLLLNNIGQLKFADFGISAELQNTQQLCSTVCGTLHYLSPERMKSEEYGPPADIWSLGLIFYTCATGEFPYSDDGGYFGLYKMIHEDPPPRLSPSWYSDDFCDFIEKCLQKDPSKRATASELLSHPWILDVPEICSKETLELLTSYKDDFSVQDLSDLRAILQILVDSYDSSAPYIRSLYELAKFDKIGNQLGISAKTVVKEFENLYSKKQNNK